jgi:hypothetical protein
MSCSHAQPVSGSLQRVGHGGKSPFDGAFVDMPVGNEAGHGSRLKHQDATFLQSDGKVGYEFGKCVEPAVDDVRLYVLWDHKAGIDRSEPGGQNPCRAVIAAGLGIGSPSATRPAAATIPAWRMPPPTMRTFRLARRIKASSPARSDPTGAPSPFETQNMTVSACRQMSAAEESR